MSANNASASSLRPDGKRPARTKNFNNNANPKRVAPNLLRNNACSSANSVKCSTSSSSSRTRATLRLPPTGPDQHERR
ncbi:hypothetical protein Ae263Ps1_6418c [Pseudonocardia sp. Ae263_Ps1]|nr:hypothetical protein Ae263Ps1_6418c [Pseudonocardia sp. Ae263_Ps1]